jgi:peptidoglycan-associated lipoprotein
MNWQRPAGMAACVLLSACASKVDLGTSATPAPIENRGDSSGPTTTAPAPASTDTRVVANVQAPAIDPLNDPKGVLVKRSVYFDYDSFEIKPEFQTLLEAHAKFLRDNRARKIALEGNADERGSREYNLALGQKRAEAVRRALTLLGVNESQLEAVSFGEEKPRALGHDEAAWAENRRADLRYL